MGIPILKAELRNINFKVKPKNLRKRGFIPGVLYGHNKDTKELQLKTKELQKIISNYGFGTMINVEIEDKKYQAIIKEVQKQTVTHNILHVDLQQLSNDEKIKLTLPLILEGRERVEDSKTVVEQQLKEINIQCFPKYIPGSIVVNANVLRNNNVLKVKDLEIAKDENVEVLNDLEDLVATLTRATKEEVIEEDNRPIYEISKSILSK